MNQHTHQRSIQNGGHLVDTGSVCFAVTPTVVFGSETRTRDGEIIGLHICSKLKRPLIGLGSNSETRCEPRPAGIFTRGEMSALSTPACMLIPMQALGYAEEIASGTLGGLPLYQRTSLCVFKHHGILPPT